MREFVSASSQYRAKNRIEPGQRPFVGEHLGDFCVEPGKVGCDPLNYIGEQCGICLAIPVAVDLMTEAMPGELTHDRFRIDPAVQLDLVKRLYRREPGNAAPPAAGPRATGAGLTPFRLQTAGRLCRRCHFPPRQDGASDPLTPGRRAPLRRPCLCAPRQREQALAPRSPRSKYRS